MDNETFSKIAEERLSSFREVLIKKNQQYAPQDKLKNFKMMASIQGCSPERALLGCVAKHLAAISQYIDEIEDTGTPRPMAQWEESGGDTAIYLGVLLPALIQERMDITKSVAQFPKDGNIEKKETIKIKEYE